MASASALGQASPAAEAAAELAAAQLEFSTDMQAEAAEEAACDTPEVAVALSAIEAAVLAPQVGDKRQLEPSAPAVTVAASASLLVSVRRRWDVTPRHRRRRPK